MAAFRIILCFTLLLSLPGISPEAAAEERVITLDQAIMRARVNSTDAAVAVNELRSAYWQYRSFRADLLPEVKLKATLPSYSKQFNSYQQSDGAYTFLRSDNLALSGELSVEQRIWLTGGQLSLTSSLDYMRQLSGDKRNRYMTVPVALKLTQPLFGVNTVKWDRRIEPVRYTEAKANFVSATEEVAMTAIQYYFNLLSAREDVSSATTNLRNAEKLYEVARAKREMGRISENDLLQIELNLLNSRSKLTSSESNLKSSMFTLRAFLDFPETVDLVPVAPSLPPLCRIDYPEAASMARRYNPLAMTIRRSQLEADYEVAKAKSDMREVNLFAQVGYTGTDAEINRAYSRLRDNQVVELGISLPILDWGKRRGRVKMAESRRELNTSRMRRREADFNQNLFVLVERFNNQSQQVALAARADTIAVKRYDSSVATFLTGRISALDLNDSQSVKDSARAKYLNELFYYWYYFYQLRSITLWDFETAMPIEYNVDE